MLFYEVKVGWRYFRIDTQIIKDGWRLGVYRIWYDGPHTAIHIGPVVISWGADQ